MGAVVFSFLCYGRRKTCERKSETKTKWKLNLKKNSFAQKIQINYTFCADLWKHSVQTVAYVLFSPNETTTRMFVGMCGADQMRLMHSLFALVKYCIRLLEAVTNYGVISFLIACRMDSIAVFSRSLYSYLFGIASVLALHCCFHFWFN